MEHFDDSYVKKLFDNSTLFIDNLEDIKITELKNTISKNSFACVKGLLNENQIRNSVKNIKNLYKFENEKFGILSPEEVQNNTSKTIIGGISYTNKKYVPRFMRVIYNPMWAKDIYKLNSSFKIAANLRNKLMGINKNFAVEKIEEGYWTASRIHQYPRGGGFLFPHNDNANEYLLKKFGKKTFYQVYINLSKYGEDFNNGGGFIIKDNKMVLYEKFSSPGDILIYSGDTEHGVMDIDPGCKIELDKINGRLAAFVSLFLDKKEFKDTKRGFNGENLLDKYNQVFK